MLIVNVMLGKGRGGLEQAGINYARSLAILGHDTINIVCKNSWAEQYLAQKNMRYIAIRRPRWWNAFARINLGHLIGKSDIAFLHGNRAAMFNRMSFFKDSNPVVIAVAHSRFFKNKKSFDGVVGLTQESVQSLALRCPDSHVYLIPNMVEMPQMNFEGGRLNDVPVIATMGRHSHEKGFDIFIEALSLLNKDGYNFKAIVGGVGHLTAEIKKQTKSLGLKDKVVFTGWVDDKDVFFKDADFFVLPSRQETFGISLIEAMSYAKPCLATNCIGPRHIIDDGKNGYLCDVSAESISNALSVFLDNAQASHAIGLQARETVYKKYSIEAVATELDKQIISSVINARKP